MTSLKKRHPITEPFQSGMLQVSALHTIYWEVSGNPNGKPAVVLHGGPGAGTDPKMRGFFDPTKYKIVLIDQRGCGLSTPHAELLENTTWDLVADIEKVREHLGIERWLVFGGSWGSTLALAYSETHPERVTELVLRGIFMLRRDELLWFYQKGASEIFPDAFEPYENHIPEAERGDMMQAYYQRLTSDDAKTRLDAAIEWSVWEGRTSFLEATEESVSRNRDPVFATAFARIECHYFVNGGFMREAQLLQEAHRIAHIPCVIVQGRYDVVCPARSAWDLHKQLPKSSLKIVSNAGHAAIEPGILHELISATDGFA